MKQWLKNMAAVGFLILFLPYTATILLSGKQGIHKEEALPPLEYQVLDALMQEDTSWIQDGTLDLLAVLCRTECVRQGSETVVKEIPSELYNGQYERLYQSVIRTRGIVITIENEYKELPYHAVSAGVTRDGYLLGEAFSYVTSVACMQDLESESYLQILNLTETELCEALGTEVEAEQIILKRDRTEYVTHVTCQDKEWQGEQFRTLLHLASSCFYIEPTETGIRITAKGNGHGFGISLYTADRMVQEGKKLEEIVRTFYQGAACITIS